MSVVSRNLQSIVNVDALEREIDLHESAQKVIQSFGANSNAVKSLLCDCKGRVITATLVANLHEVAACDSAVRDMVTTGHLAKYLSRLDILEATSNYAILGMPHELFDLVSQNERTDFFQQGGSFDFDAEVYNLPETQQMLKRESEVIDGSLR